MSELQNTVTIESTDDTRTIFHDVALFMSASDHRIKDQYTWELYWKLSGEKLNKLMNADTLEEELEGILEAIWTLVGYGLARGYKMPDAWKEIAISKNAEVRNSDEWREPNLTPFIPPEDTIIS